MRLSFVAATAVAALLGVAACSAAPRTVSIRSAGDSTPLAADPEPTTTVDPTATTVEVPDPTPTTAPATSGTTVAAVAPTTTPPTAPSNSTPPTTAQPVPVTAAPPAPTTTAADTTMTTVPKPALPVDTLTVSGFTVRTGTEGLSANKFLAEAVDAAALRTALAANGYEAPQTLFKDRAGVVVVPQLQSVDGAMMAAKASFDAAGGQRLTLVLKGDTELARAVKAQVDGLGLTMYLNPVSIVAA